jgi:hypothetical protein
MRLTAALPAAVAVAWASAGVAADGRLELRTVEGVYKHRFENGDVNGRKYVSEDVLEIVPLSSDRAYVRLRLNFYNGHLCALSGVAHVQDKALVYRPVAPAINGPCELRLEASSDKITFADRDDHCREVYCGARGMLRGMSLPAASRRPIRYLARLKASRQFQEALAEDAVARP